MNKAVVFALLLAFALGVACTLVTLNTLGVLQWTRKISNSATLKLVGVDVYEDAGLSIPVVSIEWGMFEPGETKNYSCYIINRSNVPIVLSLTTANWNPTNASQFITFTWNYDDSQIPVGEFTPITFTLHVDSAITGITAFSFDITIIGSG